MKKISNRPITEADTDFSKLQKMSLFLHSGPLFFWSQALSAILNIDLSWYDIFKQDRTF